MQTSIYTGARFFPIQGKPGKKRFASFDTEDDSKGNTLLTTFHDGESGLAFGDTEKALEFIYNLAPDRTLYLTAHNLEYDLVNLFRGRLTAVEWRFFGSRLMTAKILGTRITCWDSLNHSYHSPLSKLGEAVGLRKLETSMRWLKTGRMSATDRRYAMRDSKIVQRYMTKQQELYLKIGAQMKSTTPATALDYWRRHYMTEPVAEVSKPVRRFFKRAYYGGRVEIFRMKAKGRIEYGDVNSLYPYVMQASFPDVNNLQRDGRFGVIEATVETPSMSIPPLPLRREGKLLFPVGRFRGSWCTCELDYARSLGVRVRKVHARIGADTMTEPFKAYVQRCYSERQRADSPLANTMWKLLMNSLYGKFGTDGKAQRLVDPETVEAPTGKEFFVGDLMVVDVDTEPAPYANILWAAWCTALARIQLHKGLRAVSECGTPLYCDTDSIIWNNPARKKPLPFGKALGAWKLEARIRVFEAVAPKVYKYTTREGVTVKAKGIPHDLAGQFIATGHTGAYRKPLRMREAARRGMSPNVWISTEKSLRSGYDKRIIHADGSTSPLLVDLPSRHGKRPGKPAPSRA